MELEGYAVLPGRGVGIAVRFLDAFLPQRRPVAENWPYPEFSDHPKVVYSTPTEVMAVLASTPSASYSIYWESSVPAGVRQAWLHYTPDGGLIAGVATSGDQASRWDLLRQLVLDLGVEDAYFTEDDLPPMEVQAIVERARRAAAPKLSGGVLYP